MVIIVYLLLKAVHTFVKYPTVGGFDNRNLAMLIQIKKKKQNKTKQKQTLWKCVAENHTDNFATLKITLKINIKEGFTENYTENRPLLFRNEKKKRLTYHILIQTKYHFKS